MSVKVGEEVVEGFDMIEFVYVLVVVEQAGFIQPVVGSGCRFAAVRGEMFKKIDEEAGFLAQARCMRARHQDRAFNGMDATVVEKQGVAPWGCV